MNSIFIYHCIRNYGYKHYFIQYFNYVVYFSYCILCSLVIILSIIKIKLEMLRWNVDRSTTFHQRNLYRKKLGKLCLKKRNDEKPSASFEPKLLQSRVDFDGTIPITCIFLLKLKVVKMQQKIVFPRS